MKHNLGWNGARIILAMVCSGGVNAATEPPATLVLEQETQESAEVSNLRFRPEIGFTSFNYSDLNTRYDSFSLTGKISLAYAFPESAFDLNLSSSLTLFNLTKSAKASARVFDIGFTGGYRILGDESSWSVKILAGVVTSSMFVTDDSFGYVSISGPQIGSEVAYRISKSDALSLFVKFSPMAGNGYVLNFNTREIAMGAGYSFGSDHSSKYSVSLTYSSRVLALSFDSSSYDVLSSSLTAAAGISL